MSKAPDRIWAYVAGMCEGDEQKQFGFTEAPDLGKYSDFQAEYVRLDPAAMELAGYVPVDSVANVKPSKDAIAMIIFDAMMWAARSGGIPDSLQWADGGNSFAQREARDKSQLILSALATQPAADADQAGYERGLQEAAGVADEYLTINVLLIAPRIRALMTKGADG